MKCVAPNRVYSEYIDWTNRKPDIHYRDSYTCNTHHNGGCPPEYSSWERMPAPILIIGTDARPNTHHKYSCISDTHYIVDCIVNLSAGPIIAVP